jgi:hypothetical protein
MKSCPTCKKTFTDPHLSFCIDDGTPLILVPAPADETTVVTPSGDSAIVPPPTEIYKPRDWQAPDYQPTGFQTSTNAPTKKKTWPRVVGIAVVVVVAAIGLGLGGLLVYKLLRPTSNVNSSSPSVNRGVAPNSNLNSNAPVTQPNNENRDTGDKGAATEDDITAPPTDKEVVLATLRDLEQEWTVANINADKQKLNRILADDYTGTSADGRVHGKAEYLQTVERDTSIQKWDFEDLNVTLMGDRATLDGVLRLQLTNEEVAYKFTDKFVWRDGRWQAFGSEASRIK